MKKNVSEFLEFRYEKLKLLKRSERGEVWLASTRQSGDLVILKRVAATGLPYDVIRASDFTLPAKVLYCAADESETVIVEEFIQGETLLARLERRQFLSEEEARAILLQMCDGLAELHAQNIIHRDIKPSNMILQGDRVRLIDFDAARIFKDGKEEDTNLLGTKGYAPPEQFGYGQTDQRSDIYALGVTIKVLLGDNGSARLKKILDKCTDRDQDDRYQNVDELKDALTTDEFDDSETELSAGDSRKALFFLATRVLWFIVRQYLNTRLIVLTAGIFLLASSSTLDRAENPSEEVVTQAETSSEEKPPPAQVDAVKFPYVAAPSIEQPAVDLPPPSTLNLPPAKKFSLPAQDDAIKFPEITLPPTEPNPLELKPAPAPQPLPTPPTPSGQLKTALYMNGALFDQFEYLHESIKMSRDQWRRTQARLHITNDTGTVWKNPTIKFTLGQNWGEGTVKETRTAASLAPGESTDFVIPFELLNVSERENTSTYIQIWLSGDESKMDEHYWGAWFDMTD